MTARERADAWARANLAREVGELMLAPTADAVDDNWATRYVRYYFKGLAYYTTLDACGDEAMALSVMRDPDVLAEIEHRVDQMTPAVVHREPRAA